MSGYTPAYLTHGDPKVELPRRLCALRRRRGMTIHALADKAIVSTQSILNWESGRNYPSDASLERLAEALGVKMTELTGAKS